MPCDPETLIVLYKDVKQVLPTLNPLDAEVRHGTIEAVRRIVQRYRFSNSEQERFNRLATRLSRRELYAASGCVPSSVPLRVSDEQLLAWFVNVRALKLEIEDCRVLYHRSLNDEMTSMTGYTILRWLRDHPQGATPAEVDLLASLHDEFIYTNVQSAWAYLLRDLAPDRAFELAKTTPHHSVCAILVGTDPERGRVFDERFPTYYEDEKRRERELLDSLDDDDFP
jgi:hypothetical protein